MTAGGLFLCRVCFFWYSNEPHVVCEQLQPFTAAQKPTGKVVGIIKRNWRPFCGMLNVSQIKEVRVNSSLHHKLDIVIKLSALKYMYQPANVIMWILSAF